MRLLRALFSALVLFALAAPASAQIYGNSGMRAGNLRGGDLPPRGGYGRPMRGGYGWPMRGRGFGMAPGLLLPPLAAGAARAAAQPVDEPPPRLRHKPPRKKIARAPTRPAPKPPVAANALLNLPPPGETRLVAREALVVFKPGVSPGRIAALARRQKWETAQFRDIALLGQRIYRLRAVDDRPLGALLTALARDPAVASVQPHYVYALADDASAAPQNPAPPAENAAPPSYAPAMLHLPEAHRIAGGKAVRMALIDTAIDATHPEIAGSVAASFDASGAAAAPGRHGLGMASAIAGHKQIDGAAPQAQLLSARAFDETADGSRAVGFDVLAALDWAVAQRARIVNMSFSGPADPLLAAMLAAAAARKVILVAAAGNDGAGRRRPIPGPIPMSSRSARSTRNRVSTTTPIAAPMSRWPRRAWTCWWRRPPAPMT